MATTLRPARIKGTVTFPVDSVTPATTRLTEIPRRAKAARLAAQQIEHLSPADGEVINGHTVHSLLEAVHLAFVDHRPLVLSPDHLWLTICQGLSHHLRTDPELFRERTVLHQGRTGVDAFYDDGQPDWFAAIEDLRQGVQDGAPELHDLVMQRFSTTGPAERMAYCGVLLEMAGAYFGYNLYPICGIPSITLRGEPDDWNLLLAQTEKLARYGLGFWLEHLRPIIRQFAAASRGDIDSGFWQTIYRQSPSCGVTFVSGWIARLFPYIKNGRNHRCDIRNPMLAGAQSAKGLAHALFPTGISLVHLRHADGRLPARAFVSGFVGTNQGPSLQLEPSIGWGIVRQTDPTSVIDRLRPYLSSQGAGSDAIHSLVAEERLDMPFDLQELYRHGDGGSIPLGTWGSLDLLPLAQLRGVRSKADHDGYSELKPIADTELTRFRCDLVEFGRFNDGSTLCWAQRAGGPEILFVRRIPGDEDFIVAVTLAQLVEGLLDKAPSAADIDGCLRRRKRWPY